jgi:Cytidine and deoxycytidylate deaminase zinc-binding region
MDNDVTAPGADSDAQGLAIALGEAQTSRAQGGIPIGSALLTRAGVRLGAGHNMRVQRGSPTLHAEIAALEDAGRQPAAVYRDCTLVSLIHFHFFAFSPDPLTYYLYLYTIGACNLFFCVACWPVHNS